MWWKVTFNQRKLWKFLGGVPTTKKKAVNTKLSSLEIRNNYILNGSLYRLDG